MRCLRFFLLLLLECVPLASAVRAQAPQQFLKQFGTAEGLPQPFIYALHQDRAGYLWIGTGEGLVRFDGTTFQAFTTKEGLAENFVTQLAEDPKTGQLWVGHYQGGRSHSKGAGFSAAPKTARGPFRAQSGLPIPDSSQLGAFKRRYHPALASGTAISCLLRDQEGTFWIGTSGQGLWRLVDAHVTLFPSATRLTALGGTGRQVLAGTATGKLLRVYQQKGRLAWSPALSVIPGSITSLLPLLSSNRVVVGTDAIGVWQQTFPREQHSVALAPASDVLTKTSSFPPDLHVTTLARDAAQALWIGTIGEGVFRVTKDETQHYTTASGLLQNDVYAILPDHQGRVWFATHGTGLAVLEKGRFTVHRLVPGGIDATTLAEDAAGRVWVGTEGDGLFCYENNQFRQFTTTNSGIASNYCYGLVPTSGGLLVQHRNGLSLGRTYTFAPFTTPDNPVIHDLLPNASAVLPHLDSTVLLAARNGLVHVQLPAQLPARSRPVSLTEVEIDGERQRVTQPLHLAAGLHRVTWFFRVASLSPSGIWQYQYRLRGFHDHWSRPSNLAEADFPRLDAGQYVLEVRARRGSDGMWSQSVFASLHIATPFWRTWWFAVLVLAAGLGSAYVFTRVRTANLRRQKLQLENTVRERTAELRHEKDTTERINAELVVARDAAEASRRAKAQFLANMSHEIRTPMNAVIGLTHLLRNTPVTEEQGEYLAAIQSSSQNLLVIINDILDSSKIEAGKLTLERTPLRLPEVVERIARMFQFATESKGLYFHTEVAPNVPIAMLGDAVRLTQVLVNLVGNAVKFTTTGGVTLRVSTQAGLGAEQPLIRFAVLDTGIGIAAEKLDAIFEDFSQANTSTTRQFGGTGLGLSIARNLVQLHGGRLWVESVEGAGSTFSFEIPCTVVDAATVRPEAVGSLAPFVPALRVLVAEDNDLNQLVARKTLEAWNVEVTIAANGRLAVEAAQTAPFDAVLLDVQMPEMDGYEAARQLRMLFPSAEQFPLIGLTASALPEDRVLALEAGMNDTLAKPFDPAVLYARLAFYTGRQVTESLSSTPPTLPASAEVSSHEYAANHVTVSWELLEELSGGNEGFIHSIIHTFLAQAPQLATELQADSSPIVLRQVAHKLRGQAAYFGLDSLTERLELLEDKRTSFSAPELIAHTSYIQQELMLVYPVLRQRLGMNKLAV